MTKHSTFVYDDCGVTPCICPIGTDALTYRLCIRTNIFFSHGKYVICARTHRREVSTSVPVGQMHDTARSYNEVNCEAPFLRSRVLTNYNIYRFRCVFLLEKNLGSENHVQMMHEN